MKEGFEALLLASSTFVTVKPRRLLATLQATQNIWLAQ